MSASSSAIASALSFPVPATAAVQPYEATKQIANAKNGRVLAVICALLATCCAVTGFSAFQAPFKLLVDDDLTNALKSRTEIAALPAGPRTQTMSGFRASLPRQNAGYDKVLASNSANGSPHKRRLRDLPFQQKESRGCIASGQLSQRK
jgi:hypothetical protein